MSNLPGIPWPAIEECPDCGGFMFDSVEVSREGKSVSLDGSGGIADFGPPEPLESHVTYMACLDCDAIIVEDGEVVHEEVEA